MAPDGDGIEPIQTPVPHHPKAEGSPQASDVVKTKLRLGEAPVSDASSADRDPYPKPSIPRVRLIGSLDPGHLEARVLPLEYLTGRSRRAGGGRTHGSWRRGPCWVLAAVRACRWTRHRLVGSRYPLRGTVAGKATGHPLALRWRSPSGVCWEWGGGKSFGLWAETILFF